jgi:hypothetical protein
MIAFFGVLLVSVGFTLFKCFDQLRHACGLGWCIGFRLFETVDIGGDMSNEHITRGFNTFEYGFGLNAN